MTTREGEVEVLYAGRFLELHREGRWEFVTRKAGHRVVAIVPLTDADEVVLIEQDRPAAALRMIEWPAGLAGDGVHQGEELLLAAQRELEEETGYRASTWTELETLYASAGMTDEAATMFAARGLERVGPGGGVEGEDIVIHHVPRGEVLAWLAENRARGCGVDGRVHAGLYLLDAWLRGQPLV